MRKNINLQNMKYSLLVVHTTEAPASQLNVEFIVPFCEQPSFVWSPAIGSVVRQKGMALAWLRF
jgi:hypothetical protein